MELSPKSRNEKTLLGEARRIIASRKLRTSFFPLEMFGEPAWDILLSLYCVGSAETQSQQFLAAGSGVPTSTTIRWLKYLESEGLIARTFDHDSASNHVQLTEKACRALELYLQQE